MCPEKGILSAYIDGEVRAPWKGRIEEHLAGCDSCRRALEELGAVRSRLLAEEEPELVDAMARVRNAVSLRSPREARRWRPVTVPLPLAVAAGALFLVLGTAFIVSVYLNSEPSLVRFTASPTGLRQFEIEGKPDDVHKLLQLLNRDAEERTVIFEIPKDYPLAPLGDPWFQSVLGKGSP